MSDSVDRVFVHALATVRRLPRTGSSRPPPAARLRLYGLYKQSMEGDVSSILPRPSLPPNSPNPNDPPNLKSASVHRYASRDLRTRETQAEIEKWDAWHACAGLSRTEAKRRYITTLIETMKEYASGTSESRELVSELEFVWNQIRSQSGSDESEEGESPTRKLERSGLKQTRPQSGSGAVTGAGGSLFDRRHSSTSNLSQSQSRPQQTRTPSGLRVLSPISQRSVDDIIENEEVLDPEAGSDGGSVDEGRSPYQTSPSSPVAPRSTDPWRTTIEAHLKSLTLEVAALREQLSSHHLLSRSSFSAPHTSVYYTSLPVYRKLLYRVNLWVRWLLWTAVRQLAIQCGLLTVLMVYGRIRGDRRIENWVKGRLKGFIQWLRNGRIASALEILL